MKRIMPGALVTLREDAEVSLVRAQATKRRWTADGMLFDASEKERLKQRLEEALACSPIAVYLVLMASVHRALLLRPDTGRYVVTRTTDVVDLSEEA